MVSNRCYKNYKVILYISVACRFHHLGLISFAGLPRTAITYRFSDSVIDSAPRQSSCGRWRHFFRGVQTAGEDYFRWFSTNILRD